MQFRGTTQTVTCISTSKLILPPEWSFSILSISLSECEKNKTFFLQRCRNSKLLLSGKPFATDAKVLLSSRRDLIKMLRGFPMQLRDQLSVSMLSMHVSIIGGDRS